MEERKVHILGSAVINYVGGSDFVFWLKEEGRKKSFHMGKSRKRSDKGSSAHSACLFIVTTALENDKAYFVENDASFQK